MRTLKKTLSLVLVVVMLLGVCAFSVSAVDNFEPYKDAESVGEDYEEAVDLLVALGVVRGTSETTLDPEATYTREEGAAIVARISLGITAAEALSKNSSPFTDVEAGRWSAGYIAYCAENGILDGVGDGSFKPTGTLTGYAFAKMLLTAVGYGKADEYVGAAWEINVARDGVRKGVFSGDLDAATSEPIQRQQAILMAYNALTGVECVKFSTLINDYVAIRAASTDIVTGGSVDKQFLLSNFNAHLDADAITYASGKYNIDGIAIDSDYSEVGRTAFVWYKNTAKGPVALTKHYMSDILLGTSFKGTSYARLTSPAYGTFIAAPDDTVRWFLNGVEQTTLPTTFRKGADVSFYDTDFDGKVNTIVVVEKTVATLAAAPAYTNKGETVALPGVFVGTKDTADFEGLEGLAANDVILYVVGPDGLWHVEKAESAVTKLVSYTGSGTPASNSVNTFKDSGNTYSVSGLAGIANAAAPNNLASAIINNNIGVNAVYFFDNHGYIVSYQKAAESLSDYILLSDVGHANSYYTNTANAVYGKIVKLDGTVQEVTLAGFVLNGNTYTGLNYNGGYKAYLNNVEAAFPYDFTTQLLNQFYTYTVTGNGYILTPVVNQSTGTSATVNGYTTVANNRAAMVVNGATYYGNNNTVYMLQVARDTYRIYTGVKAAPNSTDGSTVVVAAPTNDPATALGGTATVVFLTSGYNLGTTNRVFFPGVAFVETVVDDIDTANVIETAKIYKVVKDGELIDLYLKDGAAGPALPGFYDVTYASSDEKVPEYYASLLTPMGAAENVTPAGAWGMESTCIDDNGYVRFGTKAYTYTDNVKVFTLVFNGATWVMTEGGISDVPNDVNDALYAVVDAKNDLYASEFYVVKVDDLGAYIEVTPGASGAAKLSAFDADTEALIVNGGNLVYTFAWEGPGTLGSANAAETTITHAGSYTVQITAQHQQSGAVYVYDASVDIEVTAAGILVEAE